jgi:hypothetical protein
MGVIRGILAVLALVLAGCSNTADPVTLPTPTASAVATQSPTVAPTDSPSSTGSVPPTPSAPSNEDVVAAMDAYFVAANAASEGRGLDDFRLLFADSCQLCLAQFNNFSTAYSTGQSAAGQLYESWQVSVQDVSDDQAVVVTTVDTGMIVLSDADGTEIDRFPAESGIATAWTLARDDRGEWLIVAATDLP